MTDAWRSGRMPGHRGEHFTMARRLETGALVYGVWVVRTRDRAGDGTAELLAEFRSQRFARRWCAERNTRWWATADGSVHA